MSKIKNYDVTITTSDKWFGTVEARSRSSARRIAENEFNEGNFRQIGEEITRISVSEVRS
jgi:hypothetical protein